MAGNQMVSRGEGARPSMRMHAWEMIAAFALVMPEQRSKEKCMLRPVASSLEPLGIREETLREICAGVEQAGEELRESCQGGGQPQCINIRVYVSGQDLRASAPGEWKYYLVKQIASSESDNLEALSDPCCYIDLHIHR